MTADQPVKRRHVWVSTSGGFQYPGLVIAWRHTDESGWEAYVAMKHGDGAALVTWGAGGGPASGDRRPAAAVDAPVARLTPGSSWQRRRGDLGGCYLPQSDRRAAVQQLLPQLGQLTQGPGKRAGHPVGSPGVDREQVHLG